MRLPDELSMHSIMVHYEPYPKIQWFSINHFHDPLRITSRDTVGDISHGPVQIPWPEADHTSWSRFLHLWRL